MHIGIFEDAAWEYFLPLTFLRPVFDLRCGILKLRQKIVNTLQCTSVTYIMRESLSEMFRERHLKKKVNYLPDGEIFLINGRIRSVKDITAWLPSIALGTCLVNNGEIIAARILVDNKMTITTETLNQLLSGTNVVECAIPLFHHSWELLSATPEAIADETQYFDHYTHPSETQLFHCIQKDKIYCGTNVTIEPYVVLDATNGPIILDDNSHVMANAVIKGPVYVGKKSTVKIGAKIYEGTSIGKVCKVGGEIENTIFQGFSNKQHDGFLGHSYIAEWVNLGADTNNSDLKNNYKQVKIFSYPERTYIDSGMQFYGLTYGDHSKSGINTMFNTGAVVGVGCNLYSADMFTGFVPSFSWGTGSRLSTYRVAKMLQTARVVKERRELSLTDAEEALLIDCFKRTEELRKIFNRQKR